MKKAEQLPLVSIIVPVYNAEKYLDSCLDSILNQTYTKTEIVLVDDNSTDNSIKIAKKYIKKDKRVKLVSKEANQGINQARKTGFENAIGDYIMFVDDDDIVANKLVEDHLSALSETDADVSISKAFWWDDKTTLDIESIYNSGSGELKVLRKKLAYRSLVTETSPFSDTEVGMLWNKLHKRSYFEGYDWSLSNMPAEDFMTNALLLAKVESVVYIDQVHYFHRTSNNSTMGRLGKKKGANVRQRIDIFDALYAVANVFGEISKTNGWDFENEIIYFKYRYFYIRIKAFIAGNSFSEKDYLKVRQYASSYEVEKLCSDEFHIYMSKYAYYPVIPILSSVVQFWHGFFELNNTLEFLERRINQIDCSLQEKNSYIKKLESTIDDQKKKLDYVQTLQGAMLNFIGKIKHRVLNTVHIKDMFTDHYLSRQLVKKYKNCWLIMDREENASDNGYVFYKHLLEKHPEINAFFAINKDSPDVIKLQKNGFKLVFIGTKEHNIAIRESSKLFYAYFTFRYSNSTAQRVFLGHGITKDDLPNPGIRSNDYFISTLDREQEYLSERVDMTSIKIGQPRHESLIERKREYSGDKDIITIAPTWRPWLTEQSLEKDVFFDNWQKVLRSAELAKLSDRYKIIFIIHPMMIQYSDRLNLPSYITMTSYNDLGLDKVQSLLVQTELLITDYSSIAFDAVLVGSNVMYFQFDRENFRERGHLKKGWFDYEQDGFGPVYYNCETLATAIKSYTGKIDTKYRQRITALQNDILENTEVLEKLVTLVTE